MTTGEATAAPRVRHARPAEAASVERLQTHLRDPSPDLLAYGLAMGDVLVSVTGRESAGATGAGAGPDMPVGYLLPVHGPEALHLGELAVAPEFRRQGRARGLLETAIAAATGPVTLLVAPENEAARALYEDLDFEVAERREGAYPDGDALLYRLDEE
ncbi:GNAT family N-acetyltransferase [Haloparvum sedimenti]|uniref:GNAT family N-acetyltransferase n=1 Tax=Haloparvum sedimenti TaxID=1678448 RepID=UPI00071E8623|nr:N-acetyltransferase [Haloparvum sedimenti]